MALSKIKLIPAYKKGFNVKVGNVYYSWLLSVRIFSFKATYILLIRVRARGVTLYVTAEHGKLISDWYLICTSVNSWWMFSEPSGVWSKSQSILAWGQVKERWVGKRRRWRLCPFHRVQSRIDLAPTSSVFFSSSFASLAGLEFLTLGFGWDKHI